MDQLKTDLRDYFSKDDKFNKATIKGAYDETPKVSFPLITIIEILNEDNQKYDDSNGENISNIAYQFDAICGNIPDMLATDAAMLMSRKIDDFMKNYGDGRYRALRRTGRSAVLPLVNDNTKIKSSTTYTGSLDIKRNIIYKLS